MMSGKDGGVGTLSRALGSHGKGGSRKGVGQLRAPRGWRWARGETRDWEGFLSGKDKGLSRSMSAGLGVEGEQDVRPDKLCGG